LCSEVCTSAKILGAVWCDVVYSNHGFLVATVLFGRHELSNRGLKEFQTMVGGLGTFIFLNSFSQGVFIFSFFKIL